MSEEFVYQAPEVEADVEAPAEEVESFLREAEKEAEDVEVYNPREEQEKRLGNSDPTAVRYNRAGAYIDSVSGKKFRSGVAVEVGKRHAKRLLSLGDGTLFSRA
jgi:hypothetical protein